MDENESEVRFEIDFNASSSLERPASRQGRGGKKDPDQQDNEF